MSQDAGRTAPRGARARRRRQLRDEFRRSLALTALGTVIPGSGLTRTRYRPFGWVLLLGFALGIVALSLVVLAKGPGTAVLTLAVRPDLLLGLAGTSVLLGLVWIFSIILTHRGTASAELAPSQRRGLRVLTALLCLAVAVPTAQVVRYSTIQRDVVGSVFDGKGKANSSGGATGAKPQTGSDPWKDVGRVNMLLIGSDAGSDRIGTRTDSMIVASIDPKTGDSVLLGIPRNLERVPFPKSNPLSKRYPNGYNCGSECLINAVWALAEADKKERPEDFKNDPNPGLTTIRGVIEEVTGLRMDYTTVIDLAGFQSLVDAMGGVVVDVKDRLPIGGRLGSSGQPLEVEGWIEPGQQRLDGYRALWYARSRILSDDYDRMRRQRCLIGTIVAQVNPVTMLQRYPELAAVAKNNIDTNIPAADLPAWVDLVQRMKDGKITSLAFTSRNINPANPDFRRIRAMVSAAVTPGSAPSATATPTATPASPTRSPTKSTTRPPAKTTSTPSPSTPLVDPSTDALADLRQTC